MLVADGLRVGTVAGFGEFTVEPTARILAAGFPSQRQAPFTEALFEKGFVERGEIADLANAAGVQIALR